MANSVWIGPFGIQFNGSTVVFTSPVAATSFEAASTGSFSFSSTTDPTAAADTFFVRIAANTAGMQNGSATQSFRIFLDATNYLQLGVAGVVGLASSSGTDINFFPGGTAKWVMTTAGAFNGVAGTTITAGAAITGGTLVSTGKLTSYNGVTTAGWGLAAVQSAATPLTAQVAAVASVTAYTVGAADGSFDVSANVNVTASATHAFGVVITYTDETNTPRSLTLPMAQLAGTFVASITNVTGAGPYEGATVTVRAKAATAITVTTAGTFTSVTYNVSGTIKQVA